MTDITSTDWTPQDEGNISASPNGSQGGFAPNTIPPTIRAIRGAVKRAHNKINAILTTTGTATALVLTHTVAPAALVKGERYSFFSSQTNTGAMTLAVNGLGAKSILQQDGTALKAGQVVAGSATCVIWDGTAFRLENYVSNPKISGTVSADAVNAPTITGTTITGTTVAGTHTGNGAGLTALNASNLTAGTLPNDRISGAYDGITTLAQTGMHSITMASEAIRISAPTATANPYLTFYKTIDGALTRQAYIQHSADVGISNGLVFVNDRAAVDGPGTNWLILNNTGGVDGLTHRVGSSYNTVWTKGNLPTPAVQATQVIAGNGLTGGGTLAANRTIAIGTPGTITNTTTNTVSATSHTHALTLVAADITGALGYTPSKGDGLPIGSMIMIYGNDSSAPPGFLLANGAVVTTTYPELRAFGLARGWAVTSGNPRLPDMGGYFPRGWRSGQTIDSGRTFGSVQQDAMQAHRHQRNPLNALEGVLHLPGGNGGFYSGWNKNAFEYQTTGDVADGRTADETRPSNVTVTYWVKAYDVDNTSGSINLSNVTNDVTALQARATTIEGQLIGVGQTWQDFASTRTMNTWYQNTTARPIWIAVSIVKSWSLEVGISTTSSVVVQRATQGQNYTGSGSVIIPKGHYYRVLNNDGAFINTWAELR